jgi:CubicO group peptidase (beta-lactamase class C family)
MGEAAAIVDEVLAAHALAGLSLGVVTRDGLAETVLHGIASPGRPIERDTVFRIGSVTKTMTALALLQQWEEGAFELDDPANDYLRGLELVGRPGWRPVTIRQLLTHTAGIGELAAWSDLRRPMGGLAIAAGAVAPDAATRYGGRLRLDVEPGTKWAYANHGYNVLGHLLETVTGARYADHLRTVLFDPLGMDDTDVVRGDRVRRGLATGYVNRRHRGLHVPKDVDVGTPPAGAVFSTLPDMAAYAAALLDGSRGVVKPDTLASAFAPHYRPCATHPGIGLSFFREDLEGHLVVGHGGGVPGFVTSFAVAPDDGVAVVAFTNGGGQAVALAAHRVLCALLGVPARPPRRTLRPERWGELIGYYRPDPGPLTNARLLALGGGVEIAVRERRLVLRTLAPVAALRRGVVLEPADDEGHAYVADLESLGLPPLTTHVERADGAVSLHFGGPVLGAMPALRKTGDWKNPRRVLAAAGAGAAVALLTRRIAR